MAPKRNQKEQKGPLDQFFHRVSSESQSQFMETLPVFDTQWANDEIDHAMRDFGSASHDVLSHQLNMSLIRDLDVSDHEDGGAT